MKGIQDELYIYSNKLIIKPSGKTAKINKGINAFKEILYSSLQKIIFKKSGLTGGYFQFISYGQKEEKVNLLSAVKNENVVLFNSQNDLAQEIKKYIENNIGKK